MSDVEHDALIARVSAAWAPDAARRDEILRRAVIALNSSARGFAGDLGKLFGLEPPAWLDQMMDRGMASLDEVPDQAAADMLKAATRATAHDNDYARGIARLEAAGAVVLRMPDFECDCCKDADDCFRAHGADALREMITRAEPAPKTVVGEVLKLAMISDVALRDQALREAAKALKVGLRELRAAVVKQRRKAARQRREDEATTAPVGQAERQPPFVVVHQAYRTKHGQMRQPGVYYEQTDADGNTVLAWVCSPLEVLGRNRDAASEEWGMLLRVTDPDDNRHERAMPASLLAGRGDEMRGELLGLGLQISPTNAARYWLAEYVQTWRTSARYRCVDRLGWHGDTFVMPRQVFGAPIGSDEVLFQHRHARDIPKFEQAGSLEGWRDEVAAPALGNSRLILMLSAAFAGPLVRPIGEESGGIHFFGSSSTGKTTGLRCACSVWGIAHHQWRASDNAIEATAACACDGLLPLDETGQTAPRALAATAYMLANQAGKARMSRSGNRNRPVLTWVLLFLSTGELPLTLQLAQAGIPAQAGQQVRMIEMPADAGTGHGMFEDLHGSADGEAFAQRLTAAAQRHRGHAALLFLEHLTADRPAAAAMVAATMQAWREDNLPAGATGQVSRVAGRFALIAAAGELAAAWGVVPWPAGTASAGVTECFQAWLAHRGGAGPAEIRDGIAQIRMFLEQYGSSRFEAAWEERGPSDPYVQQRAGFRRRRELLSGDGFATARTYGPGSISFCPRSGERKSARGSITA